MRKVEEVYGKVMTSIGDFNLYISPSYPQDGISPSIILDRFESSYSGEVDHNVVMSLQSVWGDYFAFVHKDIEGYPEIELQVEEE